MWLGTLRKEFRLSKQLKISIALLLVGGLLTTAAFLMAFFTAEVQTMGLYNSATAIDTVFPVAPPEWQPTDGTINFERPWFSQKIFYFHVPIAEASFLVFTVAAIFAVMFLVKKRRSYDTKSRIAMETALMFVIATMATGILWTRAAWGVWWEWEPRLTTYLIMTLLIIAYSVLRNSIEDEYRRATYSAVYAILSWVSAPISFFIVRIIPSAHPIVFQSGMATSNLLPFIIGQVGMLCIGYAIYSIRLAEEASREHLDSLKYALES